jgi:phosphoglycolate phosphatase-like HAD superfamily hydrolase
MPEQTLKRSLEALRRELEQPGDLDAELRQQLADVADSIEEVLESSVPDYQRAHEETRSAALRFEAEHPSFARVLSEVTDALAKLGI